MAKKERSSGLGLLDKIFLLVLVASVVYIGYLYFQNDILALLKMNPYVWAFFSHIFAEISKRTILGFFYVCFFGSLFFIFIPIEMIFLYYMTVGHSVPMLMIIALLGVLMGLSFDYVFGLTVGTRLVKLAVGSKFERFHNLIQKWGGIIIFLGNAIIFPIQPVSVVIGSAKYSFKKFILFTVLGLFVKIFLLVMLSVYMQDKMAPLLQNLA